MSLKLAHYYEFGEFRLEPEKKRLWRSDQLVHLTPKGIEILQVLVENHGNTVKREELLHTVWKDAFIEEGNINFNISLLRKALGQNGSIETQFIKTIPKEGYRFIADVIEVIQEEGAGETVETEVVRSGSLKAAVLRLKESESTSRSRIRWHFVGIVLLSVFCVASFGFWWGLASPAASKSQIRSIAVLPLRPLTNSDDDRALSLGFSDALISSLGTIRSVRVISTGVAEQYSDVPEEAFQIARRLNVDGIISGSFQRINGKLRVTLRMNRSDDGSQIWSGSFDESESEVFHLQESMAKETAHALSFTLQPKDIAKKPTDNVDAYSAFLRGTYLFRLRGKNTKRSIEQFKEATTLDPYFARAWAALAAAQAMGTDIEAAEVTLKKALEIDPNQPEAHATYGFIRMFHYWNRAEAEKSLDRAIELDPNSVEAHHWRGVLYSIRGQMDEAKAEMHRALDLDPLSMNLLRDIGQLHYFAREYDEAEKYCLKALALDPQYDVAGRLRLIYKMQGRDDEAFEIETKISCSSREPEKLRIECMNRARELYQRGGWTGYIESEIKAAKKELARTDRALSDRSPYYAALAWQYAWLGDSDNAIENLNRALDTKAKYETLNFTFPYLAVDPQYDSIRDDPQFARFLHRLGS